MAVQRWTDEMIDDLASSVQDLREGIGDMRVSMGDMRESITEMRESITEMQGSIIELGESVNLVNQSVDGLRVTVQALLQLAAQGQRDMAELRQRQSDTDQRFNVLLEEVRYLIRQREDKEP
jgi:methyl-accepting chemotaxis protein